MRQGGGYLVYDGQQWHPQLEVIAWVLINQEGQPWNMRWDWRCARSTGSSTRRKN